MPEFGVSRILVVAMGTGRGMRHTDENMLLETTTYQGFLSS